MMDARSSRPWLLLLPVLLVVAFNAIVPLMTVVNYSVQDILGPDRRVFVGWEFYRSVLRDPELHEALGRQLIFSFTVLAIEIPLGVALALALPRKGLAASLAMVVVALPLVIPWNVIGTIWQVFARADIGLGGAAVNAVGIDYNYAGDALDAWVTVLVMDVWHWTPLVILLAYAGLQSIPSAYYQAAAVDGASRRAVFRFIELPKLRGVLTIALLLRFMDSFMIYTEPFVLTGGGPGNSTTFLSQYLTTMATGQFDLGRAGALSLVYFLATLTLCYAFHKALTRVEEEERP
jgi:glycerol transport system permease protein